MDTPVVSGDTQERALLAGLPSRHVESAVETCRTHGRVTIPAGSPGDLDQALPGIDVLLMLSGADAVPAITWRASFLGRIEPSGDDLPERLPPSWIEERLTTIAEAPTPDDREDGDGDEDDDDETGPQSFFEVERLEPLDKQEWIFANELVRKQERGGRAFFPRAPRLIRPPD